LLECHRLLWSTSREGSVRYRWGVKNDGDRARLDSILSGLGAAFELFPCDPALADTAQFCAAYGFALDESANTIVVVGKSEPRVYAACIVLAPHRLDVNRTVRNRLGSRKASFASADETRDLTGMEIGGVTPFGLPPDLPIWVDAAVMAQPRVVLGGGSRSWKVIASPSILLSLPNVAVVEGLAAAAPPPGSD
jgi:prolyl-tRNA editing enzyme YbaK/EbsC (Cys-tRNA(Pro) deacylase)